MSFWCIFRSPLMLGGNQPENRKIERSLFTNQEVLDVNQKGLNPKLLYWKDNAMVWASRVSGSKDWYVGLFNTGDENKEVSVNFDALGIQKKAIARDLWKKTNVGEFEKSYTQNIPKHGSVLLSRFVN